MKKIRAYFDGSFFTSFEAYIGLLVIDEHENILESIQRRIPNKVQNSKDLETDALYQLVQHLDRHYSDFSVMIYGDYDPLINRIMKHVNGVIRGHFQPSNSFVRSKQYAVVNQLFKHPHWDMKVVHTSKNLAHDVARQHLENLA